MNDEFVSYCAATYSLFLRHINHQHIVDALADDGEWIPAAEHCDAVARQVDAEATYAANIRATYALSILAA